MEQSQLQTQISYIRNSLFAQEYLDEQFVQLEDLQDEENPKFVEEIVTLYYTDSVRLIRNVETTLENYPIDFNKLDDYMHQFKGSSSSIGAKRVKKECTQFQKYCTAKNAEGCIRTFQQVKEEHATLRRKLEAYFQLPEAEPYRLENMALQEDEDEERLLYVRTPSVSLERHLYHDTS